MPPQTGRVTFVRNQATSLVPVRKLSNTSSPVNVCGTAKAESAFLPDDICQAPLSGTTYPSASTSTTQLINPRTRCKNNIRSDHGNTTDIDYPNTLGFRPSTSDNNPTLSDNIRNIRQVLGIGLLGLGSPVMSTARRSYTPPTPPHSIIPAWSALDFVSISFPFVYFIYNAVNFILCSLSDVC